MPADPTAVTVAVACARAADAKQATDLQILEVADILAIVDLFVLATARSDRQLEAVVDEIEHALRHDHDRRPLRREGNADSGWVLIDYGDVVCHLFSAEQRDFYSLERLWADVPRRDVVTGHARPPATEEVLAGVGAATDRPPAADEDRR